MRELRSAKSLMELEHIATWFWLAYYTTKKENKPHTDPSTLQGWLNHYWFLTALPQQLSPFRKSQLSLKVFLVWDEYQQENQFCEKDEQGYTINREAPLNIQRVELTSQAQECLWLERDFDKSCSELADQQQLSQRIISLRYGELSFPHDEKKKYLYNDQLGLVKI
jgi:CRISPR-associated endonuclease/helicase Cas3